MPFLTAVANWWYAGRYHSRHIILRRSKVMLFIKGDPKDQTNLLIARAKGGNNSIAAPAAVGSVLSHDSSQSASQPASHHRSHSKTMHQHSPTSFSIALDIQPTACACLGCTRPNKQRQQAHIAIDLCEDRLFEMSSFIAASFIQQRNKSINMAMPQRNLD